eukprot:s996_g34.t1
MAKSQAEQPRATDAGCKLLTSHWMATCRLSQTEVSSHSGNLIRLSHLPFQAPVGFERFFGHP